MSPRSAHALLLVALALLTSLASVRPAVARELRLCALVLLPAPPVTVGDPLFVTLRLTTLEGQAVPGEPVRLYLDDLRTTVAHTDASGRAVARLPFELAAGTYVVKAAYDGSGRLGLEPTDARTILVVRPTVISLETVPPIPGARFSWDYRIVTADASGTVRITVVQRGPFHLEALPVDWAPDDRTRVEFSRWNDDLYMPAREVALPLDRTLQAGYVLSQQTWISPVDKSGRPVDAGRISSIMVVAAGRNTTHAGAGPHWFPFNRLILRIGADLQSLPLTYTIEDVIIDGSDVSNAGARRFDVSRQPIWEIPVFLHNATLSARDVVLRLPAGRSLELTYPDGVSRTFDFESSGVTTLPDLARGSYTAKVQGAGLAPTVPFDLTADREITLPLLSLLDILLVLVLPALIGIGLVFVGRPHLLRPLRPTRAGSRPEILRDS